MEGRWAGGNYSRLVWGRWTRSGWIGGVTQTNPIQCEYIRGSTSWYSSRSSSASCHPPFRSGLVPPCLYRSLHQTVPCWLPSMTVLIARDCAGGEGTWLTAPRRFFVLSGKFQATHGAPSVLTALATHRPPCLTDDWLPRCFAMRAVLPRDTYRVHSIYNT